MAFYYFEYFIFPNRYIAINDNLQKLQNKQKKYKKDTSFPKIILDLKGIREYNTVLVRPIICG